MFSFVLVKRIDGQGAHFALWPHRKAQLTHEMKYSRR